jgi:hypothetical protein
MEKFHFATLKCSSLYSTKMNVPLGEKTKSSHQGVTKYLIVKDDFFLVLSARIEPFKKYDVKI